MTDDDKPDVLHMSDAEWQRELERVARREFARKCVIDDELATKAYLAKHFPPEGTPAADDPADERSEAQQKIDAAVAAEAERFLARR